MLKGTDYSSIRKNKVYLCSIQRDVIICDPPEVAATRKTLKYRTLDRRDTKSSLSAIKRCNKLKPASCIAFLFCTNKWNDTSSSNNSRFFGSADYSGARTGRTCPTKFIPRLFSYKIWAHPINVALLISHWAPYFLFRISKSYAYPHWITTEPKPWHAVTPSQHRHRTLTAPRNQRRCFAAPHLWLCGLR